MRKRKRFWIALLTVWMLIGLSFSLNDYLFRNIVKEFEQEPLWRLLLWDAIYWPVWAGLAWLLIFRFARRLTQGRRGRASKLLMTVAIGLGFALLHRAIYLLLAAAFQRKLLNPLLLFYNLPLGLMSFCAILLAAYAFSKRDEAKEAREAEKEARLAEKEARVAEKEARVAEKEARVAEEAAHMEAEKLRFSAELAQKELQLSLVQAQLKETQLQALKMQLQPHLIQNTLGGVLALLTEDVKVAKDVLTRLGKFLSDLSSEKTVVTLSEELDCLRRYVAIEKVTLEDRLQDSYEVDPATHGAEVPNLILQPIIENAIKHGVRPISSQVRVIVTAELKDGKLRLQIKDNGRGWPDNGGGNRERVGIRNTRERLESTHGQDGRFDLRRTPDGWTVATIEMPFIKAAEQLNAEVSK